MAIVSINGTIVPAADAKIPVTDHGFLYGDGVFEGLRFYGGRVLQLTKHLDRLEESAKALDLTVPMSRSQVHEMLSELISASANENGYIRLVVTRGEGPLGIDPRQCSTGHIIAIADELSMVAPEVRAKGTRLVFASTRRYSSDQLDSRIKSLNYLNQILARLEANAAGVDEAIVLNQNGFVAEGTADNVFIVKAGVLKTPPATDGALEGITRGLILELSSALGIPFEVCSLTPFDLYTADECFLTGTGAELIPVREIAGRDIAQCPGKTYLKFEKAFASELQRDNWFM